MPGEFHLDLHARKDPFTPARLHALVCDRQAHTAHAFSQLLADKPLIMSYSSFMPS